ncbi:MAG: hypothetical protein ABIG34_05400, partial [Candidatus Peregrinibacteria bacterium]
VAVIAASDLLNDWTDPHSVKAHAADVIEIRSDPLPRAAAVVRQAPAAATAPIRASKPVRQKLVDSP